MKTEPQNGAGQGQPEAVYAYCDERERLLYEVLRFPGKKFSVRRPGPGGTWIWNLEGMERVPYRLNEVVLSDEVVLVEGEKDCETLRKLDIVASTNSGGSNGWRPELAKYFRHKRVAVIPDRDAPGKTWAARVIADLREWALSLKQIELPGLEEDSGQDVTDWLGMGHTKAELLFHLESTPKIKNSEPEKEKRLPARIPEPKPTEKKVEMPHNLDAERGVLGAILADNATLEVAAEVLQAGDFFAARHGRIFARMLEMSGARQSIDAVTLTDALRQRGELAEAGGPAYIGSLLDGVPRVSNIGHYAKIIREKALLRSMAHAAQAIQEKALGQDGTASEILDAGLSALDRIAIEGSTERGAVLAKDAIEAAMPIFERLSQGHGAMLGTPTGYAWLDEKLAGWVPGEYVVLAGRPSKGKTALALEFIRRQCDAGNPVVLFSKEMNRAAIIIRLACLVARVDSHKMRSGYLSKMEWDRVAAALARIGQWKLWIDDRPGMRSAEVRWRLRSLAKRHGIKLAVADYLQIFDAPGKDRYEKVSQVSMDFKAAASELGQISGGTFIVPAQLGRQADERKPQLSDLRESGQIEADADTVLFLYDDDEKKIVPGQQEPYDKLLEIAKQRNGPCGLHTLTFIPHCMGFEPAGARFEEHAGATDFGKAAAHDVPSDEEFFGTEVAADERG